MTHPIADMCGITGFWQPTPIEPEAGARIADAMACRIASRGPDDAGAWLDPRAGIALAHRRLTILDLSDAGHQPMTSPSGRFVMVFNGEIYNHLDLRRELELASGVPLPVRDGRTGGYWRGHSDSESLLAGFDAWGIDATLRKTVGMFAIALWDREERTLTLARDRMGEKPLYYGWQRDTLLFGSQLKALKAHPSFQGEVDRDALALLLRHSYIPAPYSIFRGIRKVLPGTWLTIPLGKGISASKAAEAVPYWSLDAAAEAGRVNPVGGSESDAAAALEERLRESIRLQMVADVPLGAFLSGGVDSSTIAALMQAQSVRPIRTFTIGFHEKGYNEAVNARAVARHLGTEHTELYVTPADALGVIPQLPDLYDEPFSDSSQIPTFLVARMAQQHVKVALSGDAGDELFGGYNRYFWANRIWRRFKRMPRAVQRVTGRAITSISPANWDRLYGALEGVIGRNLRVTQPGDKLHKLVDVLEARSPEEIYRGLVSHWKMPEDVVIGATEPPTMLTESKTFSSIPDFEHRMMLLDAISYLPDDILVKVDRAAMGVSLETRVPLLDHRVVELAWRLPLSAKIRNGQGKWILRKVLYGYVPKALIERPKMGFAVPIDAWLRGPLRGWASALLEPARIKREGFFRLEPIAAKWNEHLSGRRNWHYYLWDVLMFQSWLERQSQ